MLIDKNGRAFNPQKLPRGVKARCAVLATLREVAEPATKHAQAFNLGERATLREKRK